MESSSFWVGIWVRTNCSVLRDIKTSNICSSISSLNNSLMRFLVSSRNYNRKFFNYYLTCIILWGPSNWDVVFSRNFVNSESSKRYISTSETIAITRSNLTSWASFIFGISVSMVCCIVHIVTSLTEFSFSPIHKLNSWGGRNWCAWGAVASSSSNLSVIITSLNGCWIVHNCHCLHRGCTLCSHTLKSNGS